MSVNSFFDVFLVYLDDLDRDFFKMDRKALAKICNFFPWTDMAKRQ